MKNREEEKSQIYEKKIDININYIELEPKIYFLYWILIGFTIIIGFFFKIIFYIDSKNVSKFILGISFLRNHNFIFPLLLNFLFLLWLKYIFKSIKLLNYEYKRSFLLFLKQLKCCYFFTNLTLYILYHLILDHIYLSVISKTGFRLSKNILKVMFSGAIINHIESISNQFYSARINIVLMNYVYYLCYFLLYHNIYIIFWSSWVFNSLTELFSSYLISIFYIIFIHFCSIDDLFLTLIDFSNNQQKKRNMIYGRNEIYY